MGTVGSGGSTSSTAEIVCRTGPDLRLVEFTTESFLHALRQRDVRMAQLGHGRIRAVIHYQIDDADIDRTLTVFEEPLAGVVQAV